MKNKIISIMFLFMAFTFCNAQEMQRAEQPVKIKVASFNIQMAATPEKVYWQTRKDAAKNLLAYHKFDIFGCQETFLHQIKYVIPEGYAFVGVGRNDGVEAGEYSPVIYNTAKFEVLKSGTFWISETPEKVSKGWGAKHFRICSWGEFKHKATGRTFFFFNTHLDHRVVKAKEEGVKLLKKKIEEIAGGKTYFLTGDFNICLGDEKLKPLVDSPEFIHAKDIAKLVYAPAGGTYHAYTGVARAFIDYIWVSKNVKVNKYAVLTDRIGKLKYNYSLADKKERQKDVDYASDHFPIVAEVEF
ncbi:MAG: endonuclease/exonuclease/phosphatase family protein [Opitutales bacterium]|nr:endonuclease/exonuclease/phosphatase family protein [Opitutales bacterium]